VRGGSATWTALPWRETGRWLTVEPRRLFYTTMRSRTWQGQEASGAREKAFGDVRIGSVAAGLTPLMDAGVETSRVYSDQPIFWRSTTKIRVSLAAMLGPCELAP
jgi:hypothetical protein